VNAERIVLLGWSRAILLQLAHPLVAAGVAEHSTFRGGPLAAARRLHHTVRAMLALTFGDVSARERALEDIRAIHRRVSGRLPTPVGRFAAGTRYSAEDPDLVLWVHATLLESIPLAYDMLVAPLASAERDAYCAEAAEIALALGAREPDVPRTWAVLGRYLDAMYASGAISVGPSAAELASAVLAPAPVVAPLGWVNRLVTVGLLPPDIRRMYGFAWGPADERRLGRLVPVARAGRRLLPAAIAWWPEAREGLE
jgi:uncharacterized protein (DUF2236 family)